MGMKVSLPDGLINIKQRRGKSVPINLEQNNKNEPNKKKKLIR